MFTTPWCVTAHARLVALLALLLAAPLAATLVSSDSARAETRTSTASTRTSAGAKYVATVRVRAVRGHGRVRLVVNERNKKGKALRRRAGSRVKVDRTWRTLRTTIVARRSGSRIDAQVKVLGQAGGLRLKTTKTTVTKVSAVPKPPTPTGATATSTSGLLAIAPGQETAWGDTSKYRYMVIYAYQADRIPQIKAANPNTKVLVYLEAGATKRRTDCKSVTNATPWSRDYSTFGIDYCWLLNTGRADWLLRDALGQPVEFNDYDEFMFMDMGNAAYARQWAENAAHVARTYGFDGVWADDVNTRLGHGASNLLRVGGVTAMIDDAIYSADTVRWATEMNATLRQQPGGGIITAVNSYGDPWNQRESAHTLAIARQFDIFNREHQSQWLGGGYQCGPFKAMQPNEINDILAFAQKIQAQGTTYTAIDYGASLAGARDNQVMTFGRALWLMGWNGDDRGAYFFRPCGNTEPTANPRWMTEVGAPTGQVREVRSRDVQLPGQSWTQQAKVLARDFDGGMVLLNTTPSPVSVPVDGTYRTASGELVSGSVTLPGAVWAGPGEQGLPGGGEVLVRVP